jgi:hypothetical protein
MAREAGIPETATEGVFIANSDDLGRLIAAEREACAQICEDQMEWGEINRTIAIAAGNCADLIRERGES